MAYKEITEGFTLETLPDLDVVTLASLELFAQTPVPEVDFKQFQTPLVVGSGNAGVCGKVLLNDVLALFADESSYEQKLDAFKQIDGAFLISASGSKHAVAIAKTLQERGIRTVLLTNTIQAPAAEFVDTVHVFPKNREPYTYNTSTYMGMLLSKTKENPESILHFIQSTVAPAVKTDLSSYGAFFMILPEELILVRELFQTKFDELFGPRVVGRIFSLEQTKHAKTVVPREDELFISFGVDNTLFGKEQNRLHIPLPQDCSYAALMAICYYVIGQIQKQHQPYYKERIEAYARETSEAFGTPLSPIVE